MTRLSPTILRTLLAALSLAVLGLACEKTTTPVDVVPPGAPVAALITVSAPSGGMLTVTGQPGAVEGSATVRATNQTSGGDPVMASAGGNGAFSLQLPGGLLDVVRLRAVDEAGNVSTYTDLVSGAPFALAATSGLGQTGVVGSTLAEPLVFTLTDGGGAPVEGVEIVYALETGDGSFDPETVSSGPDGRVSSVLTLGTAAGALSVRPHAVGLTLDSVTPIAATATPGPPVSLVWAEGDGQKDAPGETLLGALRVEAQDSYGNAVAGQALTVAAGQGGSVSPTGGTTDADGGLDCSWTLGGSLGAQQLTASATGLPDGVAQAVADDAPTLTSVNPTTPVDPGDLLTLDGDNFCETEAFNTVLLGATPMTVVAASETHLSVRVPSGVLPGVYTLSLPPQPDAFGVAYGAPGMWQLPAQLYPLAVAFGLASLVLWGVAEKLARASSGAGLVFPARALVLTNFAWFVLPYLRVPGHDTPWIGATVGVWLPFAIPFFHCTQYLGVTGFRARTTGAVKPAYWFAILVALGLALFEGLRLLPPLTGRVGEAEALLLVPAVLNLHHFFIDGLIWKRARRPVTA